MGYHPDLQTTLDRYAQARSTDDPDLRWSLVHDCAAPAVVHVEPGQDAPVEGQAALAAVLGLRPAAFTFVGEPDGHHGWVRVPWRSIGDDVTMGLMVASIDKEGRLAYVLHFADPV